MKQIEILILGAGISGVAAAVLAKQKGYIPFVSDLGRISSANKLLLQEHDIEFEEGSHEEAKSVHVETVIKSPGIPSQNWMKEVGKELISEPAFALRFTKAKRIGITGSNGKTTTTALLAHIIGQNGISVVACGNIGKAVSEAVLEYPDVETLVIELSSFQLEDIGKTPFDIGIITNISADHLDRYQNDIQLYAEAKWKLAENSKHIILPMEDEILKGLTKSHPIKAFQHYFALSQHPNASAFLDDTNELVWKAINSNSKNKEIINMAMDDLLLKGKHNAANALAAGMASRILELRKENLTDGLAGFRALENRLEKVLSIRQIEFINDSKATNVNSAWFALESMTSKVVWIVGGVDKGNDYSILDNLVKEKVKAIVCLGKDNTKLIKHFSSMVSEISESDSMENAVKQAYALSDRGETVLLSPACASFDLFKNYEERGAKFKEAVKAL